MYTSVGGAHGATHGCPERHCSCLLRQPVRRCMSVLYVCLLWLPSTSALYRLLSCETPLLHSLRCRVRHVCLVLPCATTGTQMPDAAAPPDGRETPLLHSLRCRVRHLCCTHCAVVCAIGLGQGSLGKVALRQTMLLPEASCALVRRLLIVMVDTPPLRPSPLSRSRARSLLLSPRVRALSLAFSLSLAISLSLPLSPPLSPRPSLHKVCKYKNLEHIQAIFRDSIR